MSGGAWRAAEEGALGDWRLNAALGQSGRINSCWPLGDPGLGVDDAILAVERWYGARGLPAVFKLADGATWPENLGLRLAALGYKPDTETLFMTGAAAGGLDGEVALREEPDACFEAVFVDAGPGGCDARERLEALARTPPPRAFACIFQNGAPAAIGACATEAAWTGVFAMRPCLNIAGWASRGGSWPRLWRLHGRSARGRRGCRLRRRILGRSSSMRAWGSKRPIATTTGGGPKDQLARRTHQRRTATIDQIASTKPKGHAPCRKP